MSLLLNSNLSALVKIAEQKGSHIGTANLDSYIQTCVLLRGPTKKCVQDMKGTLVTRTDTHAVFQVIPYR